MRAKELADELMKNPEFEVKAAHLFEKDGYGITMNTFDIEGVEDAGFGEGVCLLDLKQEMRKRRYTKPIKC